jgi:glycosyltransferase involved in cell wall biosynthesis
MTAPIRILHLITGLNTGGAEMALLRLVSGMDLEKFEMQVVSIIPIGPIGEKIQNLGIPVTSLGMAPGRPSLSGLQQLIRQLKQFKPDILQTWLYHADLLGLLAAKIAHIPTVVWNIRGAEMDLSDYNRLSSLVVRVCAILSNEPRVVIVNSRAGQQVHTRLGYHPKEWKLIANGIDLACFSPNKAAGQTVRQEWNIAPDNILIGHAARIDPQKDHETFLRAASIVQARNPKARFVCVGDGPASYWDTQKALSTNLGLSNLLWAGRRNDMPAVYNAFDLLVLSSKSEGFPNVVAEAMACEKPCVVTDVGDSRILIGDTGISVSPSNPEALAEGLIKMLAMPAAERARLGEKARQRIEENFSLENMVSSYITLYTQIACHPL